MTGGEGTFMVPSGYPDPHKQNVNSLPMDYAYSEANPLFDKTAPSAPTSLTSPSKTATSIALSWNPSTDNVLVDHYNIYIGSAVVGTTTNHTATINGLTTGTTYNIKVSAVDEHGNESPQTSNLAVTTN